MIYQVESESQAGLSRRMVNSHADVGDDDQNSEVVEDDSHVDLAGDVRVGVADRIADGFGERQRDRLVEERTGDSGLDERDSRGAPNRRQGHRRCWQSPCEDGAHSRLIPVPLYW
ncbi:MAG TPA: hypothetical protein VLB81_03385 [Gaiellales bacterium]|nr:hypothetical protein [Gaiellales bacterium]